MKVCALAACMLHRQVLVMRDVQCVLLAYIRMPYMEKRTVNCIMGRRRKSLERWPEIPQINGCSIPNSFIKDCTTAVTFLCKLLGISLANTIAYIYTHNRHGLEQSNTLDEKILDICPRFHIRHIWGIHGCQDNFDLIWVFFNNLSKYIFCVELQTGFSF